MNEAEKVASYIATLVPDKYENFCVSNNIDITRVIPCQFEDQSQVLECLGMLQKYSLPTSILFSNQEVWGNYICSLMDERYRKGARLTMDTGSPMEFMMFLRACYRYGMPALEDDVFEVVQKLYIQAYPQLGFLTTQTYDDDMYTPIVTDAVKMSGVKNSGKKVSRSIMTGAKRRGYEELNSDKSTSIRPVVTPEEAFEFWCNAPMCRVHFSLKIDGVNTKMAFSDKKDEGLQLALSRGRSADSIDYTEAIDSMLKVKGVNVNSLAGKVTGESFVGLRELPALQSKYADKEYKTPKSTAMAMLRAPSNFTEEDYSFLSFRAFSYGDLKPDVGFRKLEEAGLEVPPYLEFAGEEIPRTSLEEFNAWMEKNVLSVMWARGQDLGIGSDGVVMYLLADINTERADVYSDSNIAIKYGYWAAISYESVVKDIIFEQKRVEASIVLEIEPVIMRDSNTATRVGVGSPDILINDDVRVGDRIEFERKSEAYNVYLRKVSSST